MPMLKSQIHPHNQNGNPIRRPYTPRVHLRKQVRRLQNGPQAIEIYPIAWLLIW